ncbi:unnamed protein product [Aphanomyces euteiches]|uniref:MARVEL domain-containing protein n=1 Tax=Aphanomyces euteiches TaxID=100861 RepID=A0A6G0WP89_9STRA|nr:hypothetical protein Ae201684_013132 [Aphanomyces euteiches]KAH9076568.1 hypothetical protein Ae201684P_010509 [Aphanomyces euteiches]KAH9118197.1 hypothetical protein AeMF1_008506 [Aphanomyces euteiches]KAH9125044.1 hypothetical protein AeMF1_004291 [Aphanomyces euteiches]KAH9136241.1 hypothetical protein LEN26_006237 [Aphanomyces euteiches]
MYWKDLFDWENYSLPLVLRAAQFLFAFIAFLTTTKLNSAGAGVFGLIVSLVVAVYAAGYFVLVSKLNKVKLTAKTKLIAEAVVCVALLLALIVVASSNHVFDLSKSAGNACCVFLGFGIVAQLVLLKITYFDEYVYEKSTQGPAQTPVAEV